MPNLDCWLVVWALGGLVVGAWGRWWDRAGRETGRAAWGRKLCILSLLALGAASLVGAAETADGLVFAGLVAGVLIVGLLWDGSAVRSGLEET